ncbi:MAG TPA: NAD(P)-dependent oxidoreductase [Terriglobales bacterium]|jgi:3-hydroxyisobutyrate dehydrogenase-like beta-hydroxyacid dehydrogenase
MKVGFIGLGNMGLGIAANLLKAGHEVTVYNRTASKADPLVKQGAHFAAQVADACHGEAVMTMLADDHALESVVFGDASVGAKGDAGIIGSLGKGAIHISLSTISVALSQKLTAAHAERGQRFVSAPVFGRPEAAAAAKLIVTASGADDDVTACTPLFEAIGQKTFRFGTKPADANLVKVSGNFLISCVIESLAEAMALVGKAGIDQHQYLDFLTSTLFAAPIYKTYGTIIVDKKFEPAGFAAPLGFKDNRLALAAAQDLQVPLPIASLIYNRFLTLLANGGEKLDWSAISLMAAKDAGEGK